MASQASASGSAATNVNVNKKPSQVAIVWHHPHLDDALSEMDDNLRILIHGYWGVDNLRALVSDAQVTPDVPESGSILGKRKGAWSPFDATILCKEPCEGSLPSGGGGPNFTLSIRSAIPVGALVKPTSASHGPCMQCNIQWGIGLCTTCWRILQWLPELSFPEKQAKFLTLPFAEAKVLEQCATKETMRKYIETHLLTLFVTWQQGFVEGNQARQIETTTSKKILPVLVDVIRHANEPDTLRTLLRNWGMGSKALLIRGRHVNEFWKIDDGKQFDEDYRWVHAFGRFVLDPWNVPAPKRGNVFSCYYQNGGNNINLVPSSFAVLFSLWTENQLPRGPVVLLDS